MPLVLVWIGQFCRDVHGGVTFTRVMAWTSCFDLNNSVIMCSAAAMAAKRTFC